MKKIDLNHLILLIEQEFREIPRGSVKPSSDMRNVIEWSSLNVLMLLSLIQVEFDVNIGAEGLSKCETISQLHDRIVEMKNS